jgi:hypothetical protein
MSLPNVAYNCTDFAVVFEAVDFFCFFRHDIFLCRYQCHIKTLSGLPSSHEENRIKSDRLPSKLTLHSSPHHITDWWQQACQSGTQ